MGSLAASHGEHIAESGHTQARPFSRVLEILKPERRDIFIVVVFAVTVSILSLATPIAVETLVNTVAFGVLVWPVVVISLVLMVCLGVAAALKAMQVFVIECLQQRLFVRVVADYSRHIPALRLENLDRSNGPELANRFFDVLTLQKSLASLLLDGVAVLVMMVVGMLSSPFIIRFCWDLMSFCWRWCFCSCSASATAGCAPAWKSQSPNMTPRPGLRRCSAVCGP